MLYSAVARRAAHTRGAGGARTGHAMRTIPLVLLACCSTVRSKLIWCNTPVLPNETLMLHGAGWAAPMGHANQRMAPKVTLQALGTSFAAAELEPLQVTDHTIMVVVPQPCRKRSPTLVGVLKRDRSMRLDSSVLTDD